MSDDNEISFGLVRRVIAHQAAGDHHHAGLSSSCAEAALSNVQPVASVSATVPVEAAVKPEEGRFPTAGWKGLVAGRLQSALFSVHTMCTYFLDTVVSDGDSSSNFKAIAATDSKSLRLFQRGFVKHIEVVAGENASAGYVFYRAKCEPEMRSSANYKLKLAVKVRPGDVDSEESSADREVERVVFAECMPCPAGKAPRASCKHVAALFFALEEFCRLGYARDVLTCTDILQAWNRPHKRKADPVKASELDWGRSGKGKRRKRTAADLEDPRASDDRGKAVAAAEGVVRRSDLRRSGLAMVMGDFLLHEADESSRRERTMLADLQQVPWKHPEVFNITDDDADGSTPSSAISDECADGSAPSSVMVNNANTNTDLCTSLCRAVSSAASTVPLTEEQWYSKHVAVDATEAKQLLEETMGQASCGAWFKARSVRVTASSVKQILSLKPSTDPANLVRRLTTSASFTTEATTYGRQHEATAVAAYCRLMSKVTGSDVIAQPSGLAIRPDYPWLGASPDGVVADSYGLVEVKCPYTCRSSSFSSVCSSLKSKFFLRATSQGLRLRRNHAYYFQIITQLFVTEASYCDFVVWSPTECHIERIFPDPLFASEYVEKLQYFYFRHMLPSLVKG